MLIRYSIKKPKKTLVVRQHYFRQVPCVHTLFQVKGSSQHELHFMCLECPQTFILNENVGICL